MSASIDFEGIGQRVNLRTVIESELGPPNRSRRWLCPFHDDSNPSLGITPDGRHWRCWSCSAAGDVVDWVARREGIELAEAVRRLDPAAGDERPRKPRDNASTGPARVESGERTPGKAAERPQGFTDPAWQAAVGRIVANAAARLWTPEGRPALEWLRSRGLAAHTIRRFRLGFIAADFNSEPLEALGTDSRGRTRTIWARRGITIPWQAPEPLPDPDELDDPAPRWAGCNVRRLPAGDVFGELPDRPKYLALAGSVRGHAYPWPDFVHPGIPALVCEGEFDALIAWQETAHLVNVLTVGGASQTPQPEALKSLAKCPAWFLAFDHDPNGTGDQGAAKFASIAPAKCRRLVLPHGKDVGEFYQAGGDVRGWVETEAARLGWPLPCRTPTHWRQKVAGWPHERWSAWRARVTELLPSTPTAEQIRVAEQLVYVEMSRGAS
jgi:DNA primase